jgi:hypothetical protein
MATNMAARRFKKASRRKSVVAERRRAEAVAASFPSLIRRAVAGPIHHCCLGGNVFESGMGMLVVARGAPGETVVCGFLLDVYCLGIKDILVRRLTMDEIDFFLERMRIEGPLVSVTPAYARKLLHDLEAWAQTIGFSPHRDYAAAEGILKDVDIAGCNDTFKFGRDGKPFYVAGPYDTPALVDQRMRQLSRHVGNGGFDYILPVDDEAILSAVAAELAEGDSSPRPGPLPPAE